MTYRPQLAAEIRAELAVRRYTVTQLALDTGYSRSLLHSRLSGSKPFDTDELEMLARVLGVTVAELWDRAAARAAA